MFKIIQKISTLTPMLFIFSLLIVTPSSAQSNNPCTVFPGMCGDKAGQGWENGYKGWFGVYYPWDSSTSSKTGYKAALVLRTGHSPSCSWYYGTCDAHVHHIFPKKFGEFWNNYHGFNINDPRVTLWWGQETGNKCSHLSNAHAYNVEWQNWINVNRTASFQQVLKKGKTINFRYQGMCPGQIFGGYAPIFVN